MEHAYAPRSKHKVGTRARSEVDPIHAPAIGKRSRVEGATGATAGASPDAAHVGQIGERVRRGLEAVRSRALPAYLRALEGSQPDPIARQLEVLRAANQVQHLLMTADVEVKALARQQPAAREVVVLRGAVDALIAQATALGVYRRPSEASARTAPTAPAGAPAARAGVPRLQLGPASANANASARTETAGHKERGWIKPAMTGGEGAAHVGAVYFRTKDHAIDEADRVHLDQLAKRYAAAAKHGGGRPAVPALTGRVVGYADPRRTSKPDNDELSRRRADTVATALAWAFVVETGLEVGRFGFERVGAGVAPGVPAAADAVAEGNALAPYRRADIFLDGRASEPAPAVAVPMVREAVPGVAPPDFGARVHGYDRWKRYIEQGHHGIINGVAAQALGHLMGNGGDYRALGLTSLGVPSTKPPWWDSRAKELPHQDGHRSFGRSVKNNAKQARDARLIGKALLLVRDFKEIAFYIEEHMPRYAQFLEARANGDLDPARLVEARRPFEYIQFMMIETEKLAREVFNLTRGG